MKDESLMNLMVSRVMRGLYIRTEEARNTVLEGLKAFSDVHVEKADVCVPSERQLCLKMACGEDERDFRFYCIWGRGPSGKADKKIVVDRTLYDAAVTLTEGNRYIDMLHVFLQNMSIQAIRTTFPVLGEVLDKASVENPFSSENEKKRLAELYRRVVDFVSSHGLTS